MQEEIVVPFAPILVESTRSVGYSFESALSDIIDNSIGKESKEIYVMYDSNDPKYVAVIDDGCGMDLDELKMAMRYGSKSSNEVRDKNDLGRFGLGLKMASMSQCRCLTVVSKKDGNVSAAQWDLDRIIETGNWTLKLFDAEETSKLLFYEYLNQKDHGTLVIWQNFDRMLNGAADTRKVFDEKMDIARQHVSLVFHRFTNSDNPNSRIKIYFNNDRIEPIDPFLSNHPATQPMVEQTLKINNEEIKVKPYILPYISKLSAKDKKQLGDINDLRQNQGFYIYRNKRLIIWGTWFRLIKQSELNKLARVRVDIPNTLDSIWEIDIKKSTASLPDVIKKNLVSIVESAVGSSERVYRYRGRKINGDELNHIWNVFDNRGTFQYKINTDLPIFKQVESFLDENGQRYLNSLIKSIEDAFPYGDVYYRVAKNESNAQSEPLKFDEVYSIGVDFIESYKQNVNNDIQTILTQLDKIDFFIKYPEVVAKLMEDFSDDK